MATPIDRIALTRFHSRPRRERGRHGGGARDLRPLRPPLARHLRGDAADARGDAGAPARVDRARLALSRRRRAGEAVGFAYAAVYRPRPAYRFTIEDSVYVAEGQRGLGIGSALLGELIAACERGPWRQMLAVVGDSGNVGSIALHRRFGFELTGTLRAVGFKFGRWVDTPILQRGLAASGVATCDAHHSNAIRSR